MTYAESDTETDDRDSDYKQPPNLEQASTTSESDWTEETDDEIMNKSRKHLNAKTKKHLKLFRR